jgi:hypothetical protein
MEAAGLPHSFGREAATIAMEYDGVGDLRRMWASAKDVTERWAIVVDIEEVLGDIQKAYPQEWGPTVPVTRELARRLEQLVGGMNVDLNAPLPKDQKL